MKQLYPAPDHRSIYRRAHRLLQFGRAAAYAQKGDKANALTDLKRAIELQPALISR